MKPRGLNKNWRRDWDSNPGGGSRPPDGFQDRCIQPLCHPSAGACIGILLEVRGTGEQSAKNPWQCQNWVAWGPCVPEIVGSARTGWQKPDNPGSANAEWRAGVRRQKNLAVPELGGARSRRASSRRANCGGAPKIRTPPQHCIYANRSPTDSLRYAAISGSLMASATFAVIHAGTVPVSNPSLGSITRA